MRPGVNPARFGGDGGRVTLCVCVRVCVRVFAPRLTRRRRRRRSRLTRRELVVVALGLIKTSSSTRTEIRTAPHPRPHIQRPCPPVHCYTMRAARDAS